MKKILSFIRAAFSKENYFRTCMLIFAATATVCMVCIAVSMVNIDFRLRNIDMALHHFSAAKGWRYSICDELSSIASELEYLTKVLNNR